MSLYHNYISIGFHAVLATVLSCLILGAFSLMILVCAKFVEFGIDWLVSRLRYRHRVTIPYLIQVQISLLWKRYLELMEKATNRTLAIIEAKQLLWIIRQLFLLDITYHILSPQERQDLQIIYEALRKLIYGPKWRSVPVSDDLL